MWNISYDNYESHRTEITTEHRDIRLSLNHTTLTMVTGALGEVSTQTVEILHNSNIRAGLYSQHLLQYNYCRLIHPYELQTTPHTADIA